MSYPVNGNQYFTSVANVSDSVSKLIVSDLTVSTQKANNLKTSDFQCLNQLGLISLWTGDLTDLSLTSSPVLKRGPESYYVCNGATVTTDYETDFLLPIIAGGGTGVNAYVYVMYLGPFVANDDVPEVALGGGNKSVLGSKKVVNDKFRQKVDELLQKRK